MFNFIKFSNFDIFSVGNIYVGSLYREICTRVSERSENKRLSIEIRYEEYSTDIPFELLFNTIFLNQRMQGEGLLESLIDIKK